MKLYSITELDEIKNLLPAISSQNFIAPKSTIEPGEYGLMVKRGDLLEQTNLFTPELVVARWGLVPNELCSTNDADKFGLHKVRFERIKYSRNMRDIYPAQRCLIPVRGLLLDGVDSLESGSAQLLAGIWTEFLRPALRIQSFGVLTRQRRGGREVVVLEPDQAQRWLDPNSSGKELKAIIEGWWAQKLFDSTPNLEIHSIPPQLEPQNRLAALDSLLEVRSETKFEPRIVAKFKPGDQVRNSGKKIGEVLKLQPDQKRGVLVRYQDGLELWQSSRELHHSRD
jgi:putative SOS response-associated peptidase YedK